MNKHIVIIGAGPGGYVAAIRAGQMGADVTLIEKKEIGGVCLNEGCIPTKALNRSAEMIGHISRAEEFGISVPEYTVNFEEIIRRKDRVIARLKAGVSGLLKRAGVKVIKGSAFIESNNTVTVTLDNGEKQTIAYDDLIVATGSQAFMPPIKGIEYAVSNREVLGLQERPETMVVIGGGVIGVELASIFQQFGTQTTILEMQDQILPTLDADVVEVLRKELTKSGVNVHTSCAVEEILPTDDGYCVRAGGREFCASLVLAAIGRKAALPQGSLEFVCERGAIVTDEYMQTNIPHVYCVGDANGKYQLAHVASAEALVAVEHIMGGNRKMSYRVVPSVIYSFPEVACIGKKEREIPGCQKGVFPYAASGKALAMGETVGYAKVMSEPQYNEIVGAQLVGFDAATLIGEIGMAMQLEATPKEVAQTIHAHPSLSEILMEACEDVSGLAIHK